jgi:hypothetical protein
MSDIIEAVKSAQREMIQGERLGYPLKHNVGKGKAIWEYVFKELGVPRTAQRVVITLDLTDIVRVQCDYWPEDVSRPA